MTKILNGLIRHDLNLDEDLQWDKIYLTSDANLAAGDTSIFSQNVLEDSQAQGYFKVSVSNGQDNTASGIISIAIQVDGITVAYNQQYLLAVGAGTTSYIHLTTSIFTELKRGSTVTYGINVPTANDFIILGNASVRKTVANSYIYPVNTWGT